MSESFRRGFFKKIKKLGQGSWRLILFYVNTIVYKGTGYILELILIFRFKLHFNFFKLMLLFISLKFQIIFFIRLFNLILLSNNFVNNI